MVMVSLFEAFEEQAELEAVTLESLELPWPKPELRVIEGGRSTEGCGFVVEGALALAEPVQVSETELVELSEPTPTPAHGRSTSPRIRRNRFRVAVLAVGLVAAGALAPALHLTSTPLAPSAALAAAGGLPLRGVYVVQPGDTVDTISARFAVGGDVAATRAAILHWLGTDVVVPGEHVAIP